jgi:hypothetical protein
VLQSAGQGVSGAQRALGSLQHRSTRLEEALGEEVALKMQTEEAVRAGAEMLGWATAEDAGCTVPQLLEAIRVRRIVLYTFQLLAIAFPSSPSHFIALIPNPCPFIFPSALSACGHQCGVL